jgi:hypothetical protein
MLLSLHGIFRWIVLVAAAAAVIVAAVGLIKQRAFKPLGRRFSSIFVGLLDLQFLLGILLFLTSPIVKSAFSNFKAAMKTQELRFFTVEHTLMMVIAVAIAHIGAVRSKKAPSDSVAYRRMLVWFAISIALIAFAIPWWRPLLRAFAGG